MSHRFFGWNIFLGKRAYKAALSWQLRMVRYRLAGTIRDTLFYLEHPDVVTVGRDAKEEDYNCVPKNIEVHQITRGGAVTYHGLGQLVVYPIFNLARQGKDLHRFVHNLEEGIIRTLAAFDLPSGRRTDHTGVWIEDRKIASIGVAVSQWISYHGAAINLYTDLKKFQMIHPCGLPPEIMTSVLKETGKKVELEEFAARLTAEFSGLFDIEFSDTDLDEINEIIDMEENTQTL